MSQQPTLIGSFEADISAIGNIAAVPTILDVVCRTTGMGFAAIARVTEDRWIACGVRDDIAFGLKPGGELKIETTICNEIRASRQAVVIDHVAEDPAFCGHPTPAMYGFQSYISMPIILPGGAFFGTLCAIDPRPARVNRPEIIGMFKLFAELIAFHLDAHQRLAASEAALLNERQTADLREQFVAVLSHDLRNPLASIDAGARVLLRAGLDEKGASIVGLIQNSVRRMSVLIDNVMDFTHSRLGGGLMVRRNDGDPLGPMLEQVVAELRLSHPHRQIEVDMADIGVLNCDRGRVGQLLSNLMSNALTHGAADSPLHVQTAITNGELTLSVANRGETIPDATLRTLFEPFVRGETESGPQGLGLGLYIASEIARSHGGTLAATSAGGETRFTFRMPVI